jgi:hypothetical protein
MHSSLRSNFESFPFNVLYLKDMTFPRMDNIGVVVDDLHRGFPQASE